LARESIDSGQAASNWTCWSGRQIKSHDQKHFLQILDRKRTAVAQLRADPSSCNFRERALEIRKSANPHRLLRALEPDSRRPNIIAEFKRRSPSAGIIRDDLTVTEIVHCYERGGACAISILTDEEYFGGSLLDLRAARSSTNLPLLRKDFVIDPSKFSKPPSLAPTPYC